MVCSVNKYWSLGEEMLKQKLLREPTLRTHLEADDLGLLKKVYNNWLRKIGDLRWVSIDPLRKKIDDSGVTNVYLWPCLLLSINFSVIFTLNHLQ